MNFITGDSVPVPVGSASAIPSIDNRYDIGSSTKRWRDGRFVNLYTGSTNVGGELTSLDTRVDTLEGKGAGATQAYVDAGDALQLNLAGGALTGQVTTTQTATLGTQLVHKAYVDAGDALQLNLAGGTLTGPVMVSTINSTIATIPSMTSNTTPSDFIMSASTNSSDAYLAFDGDNATCWASANGIYVANTGVYTGSVTTTSINTINGVISIVGEWIQFQAVTPVSVSGYAYRSAGGARGMNTYYVVYSDDAVSWTLADSRTGITYSGSDLNFTLAVPATAKYWRFIVTVVGNFYYSSLRTMVEVAKIQFTLIGGLLTSSGIIAARAHVTTGGLPTQFVKGDGSLDTMSTLTVKNGGTNTTILTSAAASAGVVMKLPTNIGTAGQFLKTDGAGQCYWD